MSLVYTLLKPDNQLEVDNLTDQFSPILVREVRSCFKGMSFTVQFFAIILLTWVFSLYFVMATSDNNYRELGSVFFFIYYLVLMLQMLIISPITVYSNIKQECQESNIELNAMAGMSGERIVYGHIQNIMLQNLLMTCIMIPFMCFSYLLQGISILAILYYLFTGAIVSGSLCAFGMLMSTSSKNHAIGTSFTQMVTMFISFIAYLIVICMCIPGNQFQFSGDSMLIDLTISILGVCMIGFVSQSIFLVGTSSQLSIHDEQALYYYRYNRRRKIEDVIRSYERNYQLDHPHGDDE